MFSIKTIIILSLFGLLTLAFGQMSIDQQINAIQHASPEQRVQMMNNLKRNIATMQASQRTATINKLRANITQHKEAPSQQQYNDGHQNEQMNHNNDLQHSEIMMQKEAADRYIQQNNINPHPTNPPPNPLPTDNRPPPPPNNFNTHWKK